MTATTTATRFTLRPATPDDCTSLVRLISALAEYEKLTHLVQTKPEALATMLFGPRPYCEAVLAEVDGRAVGFALFFHNFSTFLCKPGLYLEDLFVKPEYRERGIGKLMLKHLAKIAVDRGCPRFEWIALDWNEPAIKFYEGLGAKQLTDKRCFRMSGEPLAKLAARVM